MSRASWCLPILFALCASPLLRAEEGKLQRVREEVRQKPEEKPSSREEKKDNDKDEDDSWLCQEDDGSDSSCGTLIAGILGAGILFIAGSPFWVPHILLGDDFHVDGYFPPYPYVDHRPGYLWFDHRFEYPRRHELPDREDLANLRSWSGRVSLENGNDFDGLNRFNGQLLLETTCRFGLQTSWNYYHERIGGCTDQLLIGDANVVFRFAQHEQMQMRAGLGVRVLNDQADTDFGFNFTYGADIYPAKPLVLSLSLDAGNLGSAGVFHGRATLGVIYSRWEIYGGYDYLRIGSAALQGPMAGMRFWF